MVKNNTWLLRQNITTNQSWLSNPHHIIVSFQSANPPQARLKECFKRACVQPQYLLSNLTISTLSDRQQFQLRIPHQTAPLRLKTVSTYMPCKNRKIIRSTRMVDIVFVMEMITFRLNQAIQVRVSSKFRHLKRKESRWSRLLK